MHPGFPILFFSIVLVSCARNNPHEGQTKEDERCLESFENIVDLYLSDTSENWIPQKETWVTVDPDHKLLKPAFYQMDSLCEFLGIRDYGSVTIVEISLFVRRGSEYHETLKKIYERHLLLVGAWNEFDVNQILWSDKERIIKEEVLSERSKLIITQKE
ncbi:MAG: hypothetical protein HYZ14_17560 [Bacteroidetes bacterium]|nr:hypothetical protein [Bacteroidota bacterium]